MGHSPVEIEIQWRCTHCGHRYEQAIAVCMPTAQGAEPKVVGSGSLVCQHCGQLGPIQLGCAIVLGLSVMAGSDGAVQLPLPVPAKSADAPVLRGPQYASRN